MLRFLKKPPKTTDILLIISHPDDDALFAGELQKKWRMFEWQVVCVTWNSQSKRGKELLAWQQSLATPLECIHFLGFTDNRDDLKNGVSSIASAAIATALSKLRFQPKLVVSHNELGEYGHPHHIATHHAVCQTYPTQQKLFFGYGKEQPDLQLTGFDKTEAFRRFYPSQAKITELFDQTTETFVWDAPKL